MFSHGGGAFPAGRARQVTAVVIFFLESASTPAMPNQFTFYFAEGAGKIGWEILEKIFRNDLSDLLEKG